MPGKLGLSAVLTPVIVARVAVGESLRALARAYGISHETVRRALHEARSAASQVAPAR